MITSKDFIDWKSSPVTKAVFSDLKERIAGIGDELSLSAGQDPLWDRYKVGYAQALRDVTAVSAEDVVEVETND